MSSYVFDFYGTLADIHTDETLPSLWSGMTSVYPVDAELLKSLYYALIEEQMTGEQYFEPDLYKVFAGMFRVCFKSPTDEEVMSAARTFRKLSREYIKPYPEAKPVLEGLRERGDKVYLLSNAQAIFTRDEIKMCGLEDCFDGILLSSDAAVKKPSPKIFEKLFDMYGIDKSSAFMVGNDPTDDISGADGFGIKSFFIKTNLSPSGEYSLPASCTEIKSLSDLL